MAVAALTLPAAASCRVDLHAGFTQLDGTWDEIVERTRLARLDDVEIRVPGAEDHLRLLCLHMLGHGAWRPVWLCDIAAAIEALPEDFDWARCLRGDPRQAHWVTCAVALARRVLGARGADSLPERPVPRWLQTALLRQWGRPEHYMSTPSMSFVLRRPSLLPRALRLRWPNPIEATVDLHAPFNPLPRLPLQIAECLLRTLRFCWTGGPDMAPRPPNVRSAPAEPWRSSGPRVASGGPDMVTSPRALGPVTANP
jgi:hypothetical protein